MSKPFVGIIDVHGCFGCINLWFNVETNEVEHLVIWLAIDHDCFVVAQYHGLFLDLVALVEQLGEADNFLLEIQNEECVFKFQCSTTYICQNGGFSPFELSSHHLATSNCDCLVGGFWVIEILLVVSDMHRSTTITSHSDAFSWVLSSTILTSSSSSKQVDERCTVPHS